MLALAIAVALYALLSRSIMHGVIMPGYERLEDNEAEKDVARCAEAIQRELEHIDLMNTDWANWDDTYHFAQDRNQTYVDSNLSPETFANAALDAMVLDSRSLGRLVDLEYSRDSGGFTGHSPLRGINESDARLLAASMDTPVLGIINVDSGPLLIASRPVLATASRGSSQGYLLFGRRLDQSMVDRLRSQTHVEFSLSAISSVDSAELRQTLERLQSGERVVLQHEHEQSIRGYAALSGIDGKPAQLLTATVRRDITAQGQADMQLALLLTLGLGLFSLLLVKLMLDRFVLRRLGLLSRFVRRMGDERDLSQRFEERSRDEIGVLGREVNSMIEQIENASRELDEALQLSRQAERAKSQFLAVMSHEIRTPMNGVLGMLQLLRDSPLDEDQAEMRDTAESAAQSLLNLINDILDFTKIESGKLELESIPFKLREVLEQTVRVAEILASRKALTLKLDIAEGLPTSFLGDPLRLRQIMTNLISNAVKFTERGGVSVSVSGEAEAERWRLRITVRDSGIGIPADKLDKLFSLFTQVDASTTRKYGGTGLGLAITRQLVELMGGEITVSSVENEGSVFTLLLPLQEASTELRVFDQHFDTVGPHLHADRPSVSARILLVEDNVINQKVALRLLSRRGFSAALATTGLEALEALEDSEFDLILMDVQMPEMDGFTATALIRELGGWPSRVPIIAMTANAMQGDREQCIAAGMDDYLAKPIDAADFYELLDRYLALSRAVDIGAG